MKWKTLQHNGIMFPPEYKSRHIRVGIRGKDVKLDVGQEEMVYQWAKKKDTPYVQDRVFQKNFTADFARALGPKFKKITYSDIDFSDAYRIVDMEKIERESMTKEEKKELAKRRKEIREALKEEYGTATMDRKRVDIANYMAEPPGIFIGRGKHPLRGRWKPRVTHEDVTLNLGKHAKAPKGKWGSIVCENDATWLAKWTDQLTGKTKYVWLADTAGLKQDKDKAKYEKAARLREEIGKILDRMVRDMKSRDEKTRTIATACYLIYRTAMRVGDEKDPDEADTVGATTLRKEHISITDGAVGFDFLGKDSVRWKETVNADGHDAQFRENIKRIIAGKGPKDEIFEGITSRHVNAYYSGIVKGMTAKVFRTYLATRVVREYLAKHDTIGEKTASVKIFHAKMANLEAAKKCNHKRTIPKTFEKSLQKRRERLKGRMEKKPWEKTEERLAKARAVSPKTDKQKKKKRERVKKIREQIKVQKERYDMQVEKIKLDISLAEKTRDYNLGTSLRNYIDPRMFKAWTSHVGAEWEKLYTPVLQKKFLWVQGEKPKWQDMSW